MKINRLGTTDLMVSEVGFGAFAIGGNRSRNSYGPTDDSTSVAAIRAALDLGCCFFDTADVYGYGHSETVLARGLREAGRLNDVVIASKVGGNFDSGTTVIDFSRRHIVSAIDGSLRRLGRDHLDLYQLHNPSVGIIRQGEVFEVLDGLRTAGKIRHFGVSIHTLEEGLACLENGRARALQLEYNLFSLLDEESSLQELFAPATAQGVGLIAREPLASGFLSGRHALGTRYGDGDNRAAWPVSRRSLLIELANSLRGLARPETTLAQAAIRFVLDEPAISSVIVGIKTPEQAAENIGAALVPHVRDLVFADAPH